MSEVMEAEIWAVTAYQVLCKKEDNTTEKHLFEDKADAEAYRKELLGDDAEDDDVDGDLYPDEIEHSKHIDLKQRAAEGAARLSEATKEFAEEVSEEEEGEPDPKNQTADATGAASEPSPDTPTAGDESSRPREQTEQAAPSPTEPEPEKATEPERPEKVQE